MASRTPFWHDLSWQLLLLYLFFVGPVIAAALIVGALTRSRLERTIEAADLTLAQAIAQETTATVQNALRTVDQIAKSAASMPPDQVDFPPLFASTVAARPEIDLIYVLDAQGIVRYHYPEGPVVVIGVDFSFRPYFEEARQALAPLISTARIALSPATGRPVITVVAPVRTATDFTSTTTTRSLIAADLDLRRLSATLAKISADRTSGLSVSIVDSAGQILADSIGSRLFANLHSEFPNTLGTALSGQTGSQIEEDTAGRQWLYSFVPIVATDWGVVVQRPADLAFASPRAFQQGVQIAISVFIVGGLVFWLMLRQRVIAPLQQLSAFSSAIAQHKVNAAARTQLRKLASRPDQVGRLVADLTQMEAAIDRRFTELSTLLQTSTAVVSSLEVGRVLDTILEEVQRLLGVERCAIVALDRRHNELRLQAARGLSADYVERIRSRPIAEEAEPLSLQAIRSGQAVLVSDIATDPIYQHHFPHAQQEGYRALMAVPLIAPHALPSALIIYWSAAHQCPPEEAQLVAHFANQAAMALENAALFAQTDEKLREQTHTLEALVQSLNDGLILESSAGKILYCNRRIAELTDLTQSALVQQSAQSLRKRLFARTNGATMAQVDEPAQPCEVSIRHQGRTLDLRLQSFAVMGDDGQLIGRGHLWLDVTGDKEIDRMKSALIATASHELRSPLAVIKGNLSSLLAKDVVWDIQSQQEFIHVAHAEVDRLSALVAELLDLSRLEAGILAVQPEQCSLQYLIESALERTQSNGRVRSTLPTSLPLVMIDPVRIEVVLRNLIENAFKYSPPNSPIQVSAQCQSQTICVAVSNVGAPIPHEQWEKVFDRFHRLDTSLARQTSGAGLGLAICKGFVEAHGGKIWVESDQEATVFRFTLPVG